MVGHGNGEPSVLQTKLGHMEGEVKEMKMQLEAMRQSRLESIKATEIVESKVSITSNHKSPYNKSHGDTHLKIFEVSKLRDDLIRARSCASADERLSKESYETKLKDLELKLNHLSDGTLPDSKDFRKNDHEVSGLKSQIRNLKEELDEAHTINNEKSEQLQEYRNKYLQAQQQAEEMKRQLDLVDFDNKQVSDQIQLEIQKMKIQFQEKLQELSPLPDLLKGAQLQLQEAVQLQKLAEDNSLQLSDELNRVKEKFAIVINNLNQDKHVNAHLLEQSKNYQMALEEKQDEINELTQNLDQHKSNMIRLQEKLTQMDSRYLEKSTECAELQRALEELRTESSRTLTRCKERFDSTRRQLQNQLSETERQLIKSRAQFRSCLKDRDDIRQRLQVQVCNLYESCELSEIRMRALQNQINTLKDAYSVILAEVEESSDLSKIAMT